MNCFGVGCQKTLATFRLVERCGVDASRLRIFALDEEQKRVAVWQQLGKSVSHFSTLHVHSRQSTRSSAHRRNAVESVVTREDDRSGPRPGTRRYLARRAFTHHDGRSASELQALQLPAGRRKRKTNERVLTGLKADG